MQAVVLPYRMSGSIVLRCLVMACSPGRPAKVLICSDETAHQDLMRTALGGTGRNTQDISMLLTSLVCEVARMFKHSQGETLLVALPCH
jgi:hypothetical protein